MHFVLKFSQNDLITGPVYYFIEQLGLEGTSMIIQFQPPAMGRDATHYTRLPRASSSLVLNTSRDGASTTSLDMS